jgi:hypothetical protein
MLQPFYCAGEIVGGTKGSISANRQPPYRFRMRLQGRCCFFVVAVPAADPARRGSVHTKIDRERERVNACALANEREHVVAQCIALRVVTPLHTHIHAEAAAGADGAQRGAG